MADKKSTNDAPHGAEADPPSTTTASTPASSSTSDAMATPDKPKSSTATASFRLLLLVLMTCQNSSVVLVSRYTRASVSKEDLYVVNHIVLVTEMVKFVLAAALEYNLTNGQLLKSVKENIIDRPLDFLRILVPSLLYLIQNSLLYVALSNLTAPIFQVTYQCKLLTTALVSVVMLQRRYSLKQWICLTVLGIGVAVVVLGESEDQKKDKGEEEVGASDAAVEAADDASAPAEQSLVKGLLAVSIACVCSALAGVYFEKVLKRPTTDAGQARAPVSMWMRNVQMAFFSTCIALIQMHTATGPDAEKPFMHGFTAWAYVVVMLQAGGGLLVAAVIKYADNVLKGLATGVSVVTASLCSMILFGTTLTLQFTVGSAMILGSVYLFSNDLPAACGGTKVKIDKKVSDIENNVEMKPLVKE